MRTSLLLLSRSKRARHTVTHLGFARRAARRFIAGETCAEAMAAIQALNARGILATADHLGENVETRADAERATEDYLDLLDCIAASGVRSHASLKLTQLGLALDQSTCEANLARILSKARDIGTFVRIDMEDSTYTDRTLAVFRDMHAEFGNVGIVIQAYLYRSEADLRQLIAEGAAVRLCKGAYKEPPNVAFPRKRDVDANYLKLARMMLTEGRNGVRLAAATHDHRLIEAIKAEAAEHGIPKNAFEFQMLYGIRRDLQQQLADEGYTVRVYIPYGTEWYPYLMRRLAERPANLWFILKNLVRS